MTIKKFLLISLGVLFTLIIILFSVNFYVLQKISSRNENIININKSAQLFYEQKSTITNYVRLLDKNNVSERDDDDLSQFEDSFAKACDNNSSILDLLMTDLSSEREKDLLEKLITENNYLKESFDPIKEKYLTGIVSNENKKLSIQSIEQKRENIKNFLFSNDREVMATTSSYLLNAFMKYEEIEKMEKTFFANVDKNNLDALQNELFSFEKELKQEPFFNNNSQVFLEIIKYRNELDTFYINHLDHSANIPSLDSGLKKTNSSIGDSSFLNEIFDDLILIQKENIYIYYKFILFFSLFWFFLFLTYLFFFVYFSFKMILFPIKEITQLSDKIGSGKEVEGVDIKSSIEIKNLFKSLLNINKKQLLVGRELDEKMNEIKAKENIESLIEALDDGVLMYNRDKKVVLVNSALKRILGINTSNVTLGNLNSIFAKDNLDFHIDLSLKTKDLYKIESIEILGRTYEVAITQVSNYREEIVGGAIIFHEILLGEKNSEQTRDKVNLEPVISSHFGTPLSYIKLFTEILNSEEIGELSKKQKETISNINSLVVEMKTIIDKLQQISSLEKKNILINSENVHIASYLKDLIREFNQEKRSSETDFTLKIMIPEEIQISIDKNILSKALKTLLDNAVTYSSRENLMIEVGIKELGFNYLISVKDRGIGIPEEDKNLIFEKFFKASNSLSKNSKGSGLSLHLIKKELNAAGAELFFESKEGSGSTFFIEIPKGGMR